MDPVWQWEWEEGLGAAITTFSAACDFLDEYDGLIFNHNEAVLYQWIETYAPALFSRIRKHVEAGRWNIMGGWYLQPDCNMPSGESIARQILAGQQYFKEKFGVSPKIAVNFDSFGHSKGLVQILADADYIGYLCCRPLQELKQRDFIWKGFNNSEILLHRGVDGYNTPMGGAAERAERAIEYFKDSDIALFLWGVGNHGGGPSRKDLNDFAALMEKYRGSVEIVHSTPEEYFSEVEKKRRKLPVLEEGLNHFMQGSYTSQIRIKQSHMRLENSLAAAEKLSAYASLFGDEYPEAALRSAWEDLLFGEFHDILPGTTVASAENSALRLFSHGEETASRLRIKAFLAMAEGQEKAKDGEYPILVCNPHPYETECTVECELMLKDQNFSTEYIHIPEIYCDGKKIECQLEKEESNIPIDWRKRIVFSAKLRPSGVTRFSCYMKREKRQPVQNSFPTEGDCLVFSFPKKEVRINAKTGLVDRYVSEGRQYLGAGAFAVEVYRGYCDPWGFDYSKYKKKLGEFRLMTPSESAKFSGAGVKTLAPVRVIEDGAVRTVVEAFFRYKSSYLAVHYILGKGNSEIGLRYKLYNNEKDCVLRLHIPAAFRVGSYQGSTAYGVNNLPLGDEEVVAQDWLMMSGEGRALSILNFGTYGSRCNEEGARVTLLQSSAYTAHPIEDRKILPEDRFSARIDQGERDFEFVINGSGENSRRENISYESIVHHQKPYALNYFPTGEGRRRGLAVLLDSHAVTLSAFKRAEDGNGYIIRLYNGDKKEQRVNLSIPSLHIDSCIEIKPCEFLSYRIGKGVLKKTNILEE